MNGYFGTEAQQRMQRKSDRLTPWIMRTPGACLTGRIMGTDDPDRLGWDVIRTHLQEDGAFSFRWIDDAGLSRIKQELSALDVTIHRWDGFANTAPALGTALDRHGADGPPNDLSMHVVESEMVTALQTFYADSGIVPLSAAVLTGQICRARALAVTTAKGVIVAAGFAGRLQNKHSPLQDFAWIGLIACAPSWRGQGLGRIVTNALIRLAIDDLGAGRVMGFAASDNRASRAMLTGCGLRPVDRASYVATLTAGRFTT